MSNTTRLHFPRPRRRPRHAWTVAWACALSALATGAWLAGCSSSTDPDPGGEDATISFAPAAQGQSIRISETLEFKVSVSPPGPLAVTWTRRGLIVGSESVFLFEPEAVGPDTLRVLAESGSTVRDYYWVITVEEDPSTIPPEVQNIQVGPGPAPAEVVVSWNRVPPGATFPIVDYLVAFSHEGAITTENWDQATFLEPVPHLPGSVGYSVIPDSTDGLRPGERAWFAVRARDTQEQLSPWNRIYSTVVTWPWWADGRVLLDDGSPAPPGIIVESLQPAFSGNTDGQGSFRLGPFRNIDGVELQTTSSNAAPGGWYDYRTDFLTWEDEDITVVLIGRNPVDPACRPELVNPTGDFLKYFRWMTLTEDNPDIEKSTLLNRWEEYPLSVFVPDFINGSGLDMGGAAALAIDVWNGEMGEPYFVTAPDSASADVVFRFEAVAGADGETRIILPANPPVPWPGRVVPEKLQVLIDEFAFPNEKTVTETSMHELGHVLGVWSHAVGGDCSQAGYLMGLTGSGALDRPDPVHPDERNMVRTIRHLPQGVDLERYLQGP